MEILEINLRMATTKTLKKILTSKIITNSPNQVDKSKGDPVNFIIIKMQKNSITKIIILINSSIISLNKTVTIPIFKLI